MADGLSALHYAHDRSLGFEMAIGGNALVCGLSFLLGFLQLDLINLDPFLFIGESGIVAEGVGFVHFFALGGLGEDAVLGACERLQRANQFGIRCCFVSLDRMEGRFSRVIWVMVSGEGLLTKPGQFFDFPVVETLTFGEIIEKEENNCLE